MTRVSPNWSFAAAPALVKVAVGVEVDVQAASPELWNTSTAPFCELAPKAPRSATVPSPESATAAPRESFTPLLALDRIAVGVELVAQASSADTWKRYAPPPLGFPLSLTSAVVPSPEIATAEPARPSLSLCPALLKTAVGVEVEAH